MSKVFNPCDIENHLDEVQRLRFATLLDECVQHGYGRVTITVSGGHVNRLIVMFEERFDGKRDESPPLNPEFGG